MSNRSIYVVWGLASAVGLCACAPGGGGGGDASPDGPGADGAIADGAGGDATGSDGGFVDGALDGGAGGDAGSEDAGPAHPDIPGADRTFGAGGLATANVGTSFGGRLTSVAVQSDGRVLAYGRNVESFVVVRTLANGALDPSFGRGGFAYVPLGGINNSAIFPNGDFALTPDGRIVIANSLFLLGSMGATTELAVRLTPGGAPDPSFGTHGIALLNVPGTPESVVNGVAVQPDGRVVVAASDHVVRLQGDGTLDTSWGTNGTVEGAFGSLRTVAQSVAIAGDGRVVLGGVRWDVSTPHLAVARLTNTGAADATFGTAGVWSDTESAVDTSIFAKPSGLALQPDGKPVIAAARTTPGGTRFAVGRLGTDGALDAAFGTGGWALDPGNMNAVGSTRAVAVQRNGGLAVLGESQFSGRDALLFRLTPAGVFDTAFGDNGGGVTASRAVPFGVAVQADDAIVMAGPMQTGEQGILRDTPAGQPDATFGANGLVTVNIDFTFDRALALAVQPDGKILAGGSNAVFVGGGGASSSVARFLPDGTLDASFGTMGIAATSQEAVTRLAVDAGGRVLVGGTGRFSVTRLTPGGMPDATWGAGGTATWDVPMGSGSSCGGMAVAPDGSFYLAGWTNVSTQGGDHFVLMHALADGTLDPAFAAAGVALMPVNSAGRITAVEVQPDGKILVAGGSVFARFLPSGATDTSFGTNGSTVPVGGVQVMRLQADGKIVQVGTDGGTPLTLTVARYQSDGSVDVAFGTNGRTQLTLGSTDYFRTANVTLPGLFVNDDGTILVGAATGSDGLTEAAALFRLTADGAMDATFGAGGQMALPLSRGNSALHAIARQADGHLLLAGRAWTDEGGSDFAVVRLE